SLVALTVLASTLGACASQARAPRLEHAGRSSAGDSTPGVVLCSSRWLNGSFGPACSETPRVGVGALEPTPTPRALVPTDPWLGTIGLRGQSGACEVGMGFCVPNVLSSGVQP